VISLIKNYRRYILAALMLWQCVAPSCPMANAADSHTDFVVKPYLQLGNHSGLSKEENEELFWVSASNRDKWLLEVKSHDESNWRPQKPPSSLVLSYSVPERLYIFDNPIENLEPGRKFSYRLSKNGQKVFEGKTVARKGFNQPYKFVLFGDTGANTSSERKVVYQAYKHDPDFLVVLGDIVYDFGCLSEYLIKFFPSFSNDKAAEELGAPILQSILTFGVIGNHDIAYGANRSGVDFNKHTDALAFYQLWSEPLNGPLKQRTGPNIPKLIGTDERVQKFLESTGDRFPQMSNYSFDYGNSHWLVLDANPYMDWTNEKLRTWVAGDLKSAKTQVWKFVCFHQPGFSVDKAHYNEQRMRLLSDIFQNCGVDLVFSGHAHNYQRSYPLIFHGQNKNGIPVMNNDGTVDGGLTLDKKFDGVKNVKPSGVIYIVSGGGGASLYASLADSPSRKKLSTSPDILKKAFTDKFDASTHSLTVCQVDNHKLSVKQISEDGKEIDSFVIEKNSVSR